MDGRISRLIDEPEEYDNSPENSGDSPPSSVFSDTKIMTSSTSSPRRRRGMQKRVVSVPIKDVERSKLKGEMSAPPSDSWAWRKYGQKPIKGSPYPRGYYRCSSSKSCPARKQVERSRADPTTLLVTYSCEHNHPWPASRSNANRNHRRNNQNITTTAATISTSSTNVTISISEDDQKPEMFESDEKFTNLEGSLISDFGWFSDLESTSSTLLESPLLARDCAGDVDMATIFSMGEEEESLFADLGELPEYSLVFRRGMDHRRCSLTTL